MRLLFFLILFLIFIPLASASLVERKIEVRDVYFNSSGIYVLLNKEYTITLTPLPLIDFDSPGYYIIEYLPKGFTFISTTADKYILVDNKLQMLKFRPTNDNSTLTYKLQYKKDFNPISSFYGTYLDENRVYGVVTQYGSTSTSSNAIVRDSTPSVSYEKNTNKNGFTSSSNIDKLVSEFIPISSSPVAVVPYVTSDNNSGSGILIIVILSFIIFGLVFVVLTPSYHRVFHIRLLESDDVIIDKEAVGITKELKFTLITKSSLSVKITGDISKVITSIQELPCDNRCYVITITPDGREHTGTIIFTKKNMKNVKYKIKKVTVSVGA